MPPASTIRQALACRRQFPVLRQRPIVSPAILPSGWTHPNTRVVPILRKFLPALMLLIASIALSVPAAASMTHAVGHIPTPVSAGEHHHHADNGNVDVHDESAPDGSGQSGGKGAAHSHAPGLGAEPAMLGSTVAPLSLLAAQVRQEWTVRELKTLSWSPHRRPPRTA